MILLTLKHCFGLTLCETSSELKNNMNKYKLYKTAAIFFLAILFLKQGISKVYAMVDFIHIGLLKP